MPLEDAETLVRVMEMERETPVSFTLKVRFKQNRFLWELCCLLNLGVGTRSRCCCEIKCINNAIIKKNPLQSCFLNHFVEKLLPIP